MKERWNKMTTRDRIINVLIIVLSVVVIILAALQLLGIWEDSINVYEPLIGIVLLLQAIYHWKKNRSVIWFMMLGFNLLIPAILLSAEKLFLKKAPKNINWIFGYRTTMSMKNEDTWAFAHKVAGAFWWKWGWGALAVTTATMLLVLGRSEKLISTAGCFLMFAQMIPLIAVIPHTEKALRNTFDKAGNRKEKASC